MFAKLRSADSLGSVVTAILHPDLSIDMKHKFDPKHGNEVSRQFLNWHASIGRHPFFAVLNYFDAHQPYYAPREFQRFARDSGRGGAGELVVGDRSPPVRRGGEKVQLRGERHDVAATMQMAQAAPTWHGRDARATAPSRRCSA